MHHQQNQNALSKSIGALATVIGFLAAFVLSPGLSAQTLPWAIGTLNHHYGSSLHLILGDLFIWVWIIAVGVTVFLTIRMLATILLMMVNNWLLLRL